MTIELRDYQQAMVGEARQLLRAGSKRLLVQAPTGAGKTVMMAYMIRGVAQGNRRAMLLVHREELAKQSSKTLTRVGVPHSFVMAAYTMDRTARVHIAMIDTLRNRLDKVPVPDVVFVDECHHSCSASWAKVINYFHERGAVIIGVSATPERSDGKGLDAMFDHMVHGPQTAELIERGSLSQFDYLAPPSMLDLSGVHTTMGDYDRSELAAASDKPAIIGNAIEHYQRELGGKRAISFCVTIEHSKHVAEQFRAAGIPAEHVDGEMDKTERAAAIRRFESGETLVLSNVSLFGEGFDVAACDGVILLRATKSKALHLQMIGRALRPHPDKPRSIILDHVGNFKVKGLGLPDDERIWTLEGRKKRKAGEKDAADDGPQYMQCPKCYRAHLEAPHCPHCGYVYEVKEAVGRGELEQKEGKLIRITPEMRAQLQAEKKAAAAAVSAEKKTKIKAAKTLDELEAVGRELGYAENWAANAFVRRQQLAEKYRKKFEVPLSVYEDEFRR